MRGASRRVALALLLAACGGGNSGSTPTTPGGGGGGGSPPPSVQTVLVLPPTVSLRVGGTAALAASPRTAAGAEVTGRTVSWNSGTPGVATVNAAGVVTAVAPGSATVTATVDGVTGSAAVTVTQMPVVAVAVTPVSTSLRVGGTLALAAAARDSAGGAVMGRPVTWSSSAPTVATVSPSGVVTAIAPGSATVTAAVEGVTGSAAIAVLPIPVASVLVSPPTGGVQVGATLTLTATPRDSAGMTLAGRAVAWSSSAPGIATVSSAGVVTGVAPGTASIGATVEGMRGDATITVTSVASSCTTRPTLTHALVDPSALQVITQIGVVGGANTSLVGRSYAFPTAAQTGVRLPLSAPAALRVVALGHYRPTGAPAGYVPDWSMYVDYGCGLTMELYHVKDLPAALKAATDTTIVTSSAWQPLATPVALQAGAPLGWYIKGLNSLAFDVVLYDTTVVNRFENQARHTALFRNLLNAACPWSYFEPGLRSRYLGLIGGPGGNPVPGAGCGTIERDVPGTPSGQWFQSASVPASWTLSKSGMYGDPLPIVMGPDSTVQVGHIGPNSDLRVSRNNATWRNPATITTAWCYVGDVGGWLWLRMNSRTQMDVAFGETGNCPASFPATGFMAYYR